ncbi:hypothetical protein D9613_012395 [Agrocybe pediades]|uniref:Alpha-type protein kinase domain-containing protein n=1 Tax=Agrocybe pediades TaxID=84607 RepID=A0A8H4QRZ3_9AGAR|nr:hypothetical protein D9613_012395 [Agrocybe pediades]
MAPTPQVYPPYPLTSCLKCGGRHSQPKICRGEGQYAENYNRRYSLCSACGEFVWYDPPTPITQIPPEVLQVISNLQKAKAAPGTVECANEGCVTAGNKRRDANKLCTRVGSGPLCKQCCVALGGCRVHAGAPGRFNQTAGPGVQPIVSGVPAAGSSLDVNPASISMHQLLMQYPTPSTQSAIPASLSTTSQASVESRPPPPKKSYARPFDEEGYGRLARVAQSQAHSERQSRAERHAKEKGIMEQRNNKQQVKIWFEASEKPKTLQVILPIYGVLVPLEHNSIMRLLGPSCQYLEVFTVFHLASEFVLQEVQVPIDTFAAVPVLLLKDGLKAECCLGLDEEMAKVLEESQHRFSQRELGKGKTLLSPHALEKRRMRSRSPTSSFSSLPLSSPSKASSSSFTISTRKKSSSTSPLTFPLAYVCEMKQGFERMLKLSNKTASSVESSFLFHWPRCKFVRSSYYKHQLVYKKAKDAGLLRRFIQAGRTEEGKWSVLVKAVDQLPADAEVLELSESSEEETEPRKSFQHASATAANMQAVPQPHIPDPSLANITYEVYEVRVEYFKIKDDLSDVYAWAENDIYRPAMVQNGPDAGSKKNVYKMLLSWNQRDSEDSLCVLKKVSLPRDWWVPAPSEDIAYLAEGMELWHSYVLMEQFATAVDKASVFSNEGFSLFTLPIKFAPTAFLSTDTGPLGLAQPFISGLYFTRKSLVEQNNDLAVDTLDAFSHFVFEITGGLKVVTEMQGKIAPEGSLVVFDSRTHTKTTDVEYTTIRRYSLGNRGDLGIDDFRREHQCCMACLTLGLKRVEDIGK